MYDEEDLDDDMNNDMEASSSLRLTSTKTQLSQNTEKVGSTNVRRFARNTGTYQSSFSKPTAHDERRDKDRSPDSEAEYHYYNKQH